MRLPRFESRSPVSNSRGRVVAQFLRTTSLLLTLLLVANNTTALADDWPQWRGPNRDGRWHETGILRQIPKEGIPRKWSVPIHMGYSGPAVVGGKVFITDYSEESGDTTNEGNTRRPLTGTERIVCFNAETGDLVWEHAYPCEYNIGYPSGPRATPTVSGDKVYALGAQGNLTCLNIQSGKVIWTGDLDRYRRLPPDWGYCCAPLVEGKHLICQARGKGSIVVAFDKETGEEIWKGVDGDTGYVPPSIVEAAGVRQLIVWNTKEIISLNPETGTKYWGVPLKAGFTMSVMMPQRHRDFLFASANPGVGALIKLDTTKPAAEVVWRSTDSRGIYSTNSTPMIDDSGTVYGVDTQSGELRAMELQTETVLWSTLGPTTGQGQAKHATAHLVQNNDRYFLFSETGDLILANLTPKSYEEVGRFRLIEPTGECYGRQVAWSHPAFANKCVFARSDKELVCVSLATEKP